MIDKIKEYLMLSALLDTIIESEALTWWEKHEMVFSSDIQAKLDRLFPVTYSTWYETNPEFDTQSYHDAVTNKANQLRSLLEDYELKLADIHF